MITLKSVEQASEDVEHGLQTESVQNSSEVERRADGGEFQIV